MAKWKDLFMLDVLLRRRWIATTGHVERVAMAESKKREENFSDKKWVKKIPHFIWR